MLSKDFWINPCLSRGKRIRSSSCVQKATFSHCRFSDSKRKHRQIDTAPTLAGPRVVFDRTSPSQISGAEDSGSDMSGSWGSQSLTLAAQARESWAGPHSSFLGVALTEHSIPQLQVEKQLSGDNPCAERLCCLSPLYYRSFHILLCNSPFPLFPEMKP